MNPTENKSMGTKLKVGIFTGAVVLVGAIVALFKGAGVPASTAVGTDSSGTQSGQTTQSSSSGAAGNPVTTPPVATAPTYKDGTYSADGNYDSPGGPDAIGVTLTLKDDVVTGVTVAPKPGDRMSARYQDMFISGYKQYVVGKKIDSLNLGKVSGSSLTPIGFNDAVAKIKAQAKA